MKKEDFTTRLLKLFFHIQDPLDECRQEIIYRACARALIQIVYSSLLFFLFYLLFGRGRPVRDSSQKLQQKPNQSS